MKTHLEILATLEEIEGMARMACLEAYENRKELDWPVNWADFHPVEVRYFVTKDDSGYEVFIEEASPGNGKMRNWFNQFFLDRGYTTPPEFRFEW